MNELQIFNNEELNLKVRAIQNDDGSISINAEDTARGFGWTTVAKSGNEVVRWARLNEYCNEFGFPKQVGKDDYIPESLFYRLGMKANNAVADKFQNWLAIEVIPSIRKTGHYESKQPQGKELLALAVIEAQKTISELQNSNLLLEQRIEQDRPKTIFADSVSSSKQSILIGDLAKLICQNGHPIGQKRLFQWMRDNGYLIKSGSSYNMPMQRYVEQGLFEVKESTVNNPDGSVRLTRTTKITGKGQIYFVNKFIKEKKYKEDKGNAKDDCSVSYTELD